MVQTPQGEYRRNRLQLRKLQYLAQFQSVAVLSSLLLVPQYNLPVFLCMQIMCTLILYGLSRNYPIIIKGIPMSQLNVPLIPQNAENGGKPEIKEPRRSSRPHKPNPYYMDTASMNSSNWYNKFIGNLMTSRTLNHADTFILQVNLKLTHVISPTG